MRACLDPFSFLVVSVAAWLNQRQQHVIDYVIEEIALCGSKLVIVYSDFRTTSDTGEFQGRSRAGTNRNVSDHQDTKTK